MCRLNRLFRMFLLDEKFEGLIGSDVERDGMYLEISESPYNSVEAILEIFYSDVTDKFSITLFKDNVSLELIEEAIKTAKHRLVPNK